MVSDDFKPSYNRFVPGSTPEQATDTSTNTSQRNPVNPFSGTSVPLVCYTKINEELYFNINKRQTNSCSLYKLNNTNPY